MHAAAGIDPEFGRGSIVFDRFSSETTDLHALREPPFYALQVLPGCLGTRGGLQIDEHGRVLRADQAGYIPGLYAVGNASANCFGCAYPGPGSTIGPALVFGWFAGAAAGDGEPDDHPAPNQIGYTIMKLSCGTDSFPILAHEVTVELIAGLGFEGHDVMLEANRRDIPLAEVRRDINGWAGRLDERVRGRGLEFSDIAAAAISPPWPRITPIQHSVNSGWPSFVTF